jgi:hypothetical protein
MEHATIFSDIHVNLAALEAVLADIKVQNQSPPYRLSHLVGYGTFPNEVIAIIRGGKPSTTLCPAILIAYRGQSLHSPSAISSRLQFAALLTVVRLSPLSRIRTHCTLLRTSP